MSKLIKKKYVLAIVAVILLLILVKSIYQKPDIYEENADSFTEDFKVLSSNQEQEIIGEDLDNASHVEETVSKDDNNMLAKIQELMEANMTLKMSNIDDLLSSFVLDQELVDAMFKGVEDYKSTFSMLEYREEIIGEKVNETMFINQDIVNIIILNAEDIIYEISPSSISCENLQDNSNTTYKMSSFVNPNNKDELVFFKKVKNIFNNEDGFIVFIIKSDYLKRDLDSLNREIEANVEFDIRDMNETSIYMKDLLEVKGERISSFNKYGWESIIISKN